MSTFERWWYPALSNGRKGPGTLPSLPLTKTGTVVGMFSGRVLATGLQEGFASECAFHGFSILVRLHRALLNFHGHVPESTWHDIMIVPHKVGVKGKGCPVLSVGWKGPDYHRRSVITDWCSVSPYHRAVRRHLKRYYGYGHLHFITFSCYQRRPLLQEPWARDRFLRILEEVRRKFRFVVVGYVVMPEHVHLLINEPKVGTPSTAMQVLKQRSSRAIRGIPALSKRRKGPGTPHVEERFWQLRFYDFNVWSVPKHIEKLKYMHRNPITRGLAAAPEEWRWSSYRAYAFDEKGIVGVNEGWEVLPKTQTV